jgi:anti-sigma regulatory factor (Ser/Thr protein kinase)/anti-anti-sigma regulatory factor
MAVQVAEGVRRAGSDWYDVLGLEDGRVALVVGRIPDTGDPLTPGVLVERLRGAITTTLAQGAGALDTVQVLRQYAGYQPELQGTTLCLLVFDPPSGRLDCATAGHPGPLVLGGDGGVRQIVGDRGGPLLAAAARRRSRSAVLIRDEEVVLLYSIEAVRRRAGLNGSGPRRFAELVARHTRVDTDPENLCAALIKELAEVPAGAGDVVLLALAPGRWAAESFLLDFPARSGELVTVRRQFGDWLAGVGLDADDAYDLVLAMNEAASNAVEHAYDSGTEGTVRVTANVSRDGTIHTVVSDRGRWRVPPAALSSRGRGLLLMRESVDQVIVDRAESGTTVTLCVTPRRTVVLRDDRTDQSPHPPRGHEVVVQEYSGRVQVAVRGEVPAHTAPALRRTLLTAARGGSVPVVVDLAEAGAETDGVVSALFAVSEAAEAAGNRVVVLAPAGSSAREAVSAAGLHRIADVRDDVQLVAGPDGQTWSSAATASSTVP